MLLLVRHLLLVAMHLLLFRDKTCPNINRGRATKRTSHWIPALEWATKRYQDWPKKLRTIKLFFNSLPSPSLFLKKSTSILFMYLLRYDCHLFTFLCMLASLKNSESQGIWPTKMTVGKKMSTNNKNVIACFSFLQTLDRSICCCSFSFFGPSSFLAFSRVNLRTFSNYQLHLDILAPTTPQLWLDFNGLTQRNLQHKTVVWWSLWAQNGVVLLPASIQSCHLRENLGFCHKQMR